MSWSIAGQEGAGKADRWAMQTRHFLSFCETRRAYAHPSGGGTGEESLAEVPGSDALESVLPSVPRLPGILRSTHCRRRAYDQPRCWSVSGAQKVSVAALIPQIDGSPPISTIISFYAESGGISSPV